MSFKCKIREEDITYGTWDPDELEAWVIAGKLMKEGYRTVSYTHLTLPTILRV